MPFVPGIFHCAGATIMTRSENIRIAKMSSQLVTLERKDDLVRVTLPMPLPYSPDPIPIWVYGQDPCAVLLFSPLLAIWQLAVAIHRYRNPLVPPPRALFEIDSNTLRISFWSPRDGERTSVQYPRSSIVEVRKHRYGKGLWMRAQGIRQGTYLEDTPDETIEELSEILRSILLPAPCTDLT